MKPLASPISDLGYFMLALTIGREDSCQEQEKNFHVRSDGLKVLLVDVLPPEP